MWKQKFKKFNENGFALSKMNVEEPDGLPIINVLKYFDDHKNDLVQENASITSIKISLQ